MFYIVWRNYDTYYQEKFSDHIELAERLLAISRDVEKGDYGTEILLVVKGTEVDFKYKFDKANHDEKLFIDGDIVITRSNIVEEKRMGCPTCGSASKKSGCVSTFVEGEYSTLDRYKCSACSKKFYI